MKVSKKLADRLQSRIKYVKDMQELSGRMIDKFCDMCEDVFESDLSNEVKSLVQGYKRTLDNSIELLVNINSMKSSVDYLVKGNSKGIAYVFEYICSAFNIVNKSCDFLADIRSGLAGSAYRSKVFTDERLYMLVVYIDGLLYLMDIIVKEMCSVRWILINSLEDTLSNSKIVLKASDERR